MSSAPEGITWLETVIVVRVETIADAWPFDEAVVASLVQLPWRLVQVDRAGLRGVLEVDDDAVAKLGALTSAIDQLATVEVRDDVSIVIVDASTAVRRSTIAGAIGTALASLGAEPVAMFVDGPRLAVAFERWRRDALSEALRTATSLSR